MSSLEGPQLSSTWRMQPALSHLWTAREMNPGVTTGHSSALTPARVISVPVPSLKPWVESNAGGEPWAQRSRSL